MRPKEELKKDILSIITETFPNMKERITL